MAVNFAASWKLPQAIPIYVTIPDADTMTTSMRKFLLARRALQVCDASHLTL
jgi:hypothetical protein